MPLLKLFEIIENLLGFTNDEPQYHHKRRLPETPDISINHIHNNAGHSSVKISDIPTVSVFFSYSSSIN
jgi:hypothetical protein